jgi:hypothetical protein
MTNLLVDVGVAYGNNNIFREDTEDAGKIF